MEYKGGPEDVLQPRTPDIQRAQRIATRNTIIQSVTWAAAGEKKTRTFISINWLAIINAILLPLSLHIAARATPPSPLGPLTFLPPIPVPTLPLLSLSICFSLSLSPSSSAIFAMSLHFLTIPYVVSRYPTKSPAQYLSLAWRTSSSNGTRRLKT
jgi:hypothetical protein